MEHVVMTPQIIGELIDNLANGDAASIVASGLSLILSDELRCKIVGDRCEVFVYGNMIESAKVISSLVLSIPTISDHGDYDGTCFRFGECHVYAIVEMAKRSS
jgi:hypothetical protein